MPHLLLVLATANYGGLRTTVMPSFLNENESEAGWKQTGSGGEETGGDEQKVILGFDDSGSLRGGTGKRKGSGRWSLEKEEKEVMNEGGDSSYNCLRMCHMG
ncbi:hypothetical protein Baya_4729 [Bagarius yarrelli]|uniref:Uncharacterized protein n=1 Tax=Bagarius yarrelli TaxID=175774 RepID=A0A556TTC3_BAGYA|nr:hypothetical protein Baya_4729 [Bagarius yarrelli]